MDIITSTLIAALIGVLLLIYSLKRKQNEKCTLEVKSIHGLSQSESKNGQIVFGQFSQFLKDLHQRFGPVASFYHNNVYSVSVCDPALMKPLRHLENRQSDIFEQFEIVIGKESFASQDLEEIRRRRKLYDHHFMLKACKSYTECFLQIAKEYVERWKKLRKDDHVPLCETATDATLKGILLCNYGDYFQDEQSVQRFKQLFEKMLKLMEEEISLKPNSAEEIQFKIYGNEIKGVVENILICREQDTSDTEKNLFIDVLLKGLETKEAQIADSILFIMLGYDFAGKLIMWALYELCIQPKLQEKVYEELKSVLGDNQVTLEMIPKLRYLSQVVDETIRFRLDTVFSTREIKEELRVGDYIVPANSRLFINSGLSFKDKKYYANPETFDPEHFSPENTKSRNAYAWKPFGFAGKRQCPGQTYVRTKISIFLAEWIRQFQFKLVADQDLKFVQGTRGGYLGHIGVEKLTEKY